jgi:DNA-binding transcriptional LysR family regulator
VLRFRDRYPDVELTITMADPADSLPRLHAGELDLALSHDPAWLTDHVDGLELIDLFEDPMYVALPAGHHLADEPSLTLGQFAHDAWMLGTPASCPDSRLFRRACMEAGFEPRVALENDDYGAIVGFVAAGVGVALIPEMVTRVLRHDVVIRELDPAPPSRPISVALPAGYRSPAASAMVAVLEEVAAEWVAERSSALATLR